MISGYRADGNDFKETFWGILPQSELIRPGLIRVRVVRSNFCTCLLNLTIKLVYLSAEKQTW